MNENQFNGAPRGTGTSVVMGVVFGALVGAGIALLLAPGTGRDTRRRLADTGRRWGGSARNKFDQARNTASDLKQDAKSALVAGREAFKRGQESREPLPTSGTELKGYPK